MSGDARQDGIVNVDVQQVWERLKENPDAQLVDVRTQAEWAFVGVPDLTPLGKELVCVEWQQFPGGALNVSFADRLKSELAARGAGEDTELYFICRSGQRSLHSAETMAAEGFRACHNVADGFEGPLDGTSHRGSLAGWKAAGLPWVQR